MQRKIKLVLLSLVCVWGLSACGNLEKADFGSTGGTSTSDKSNKYQISGSTDGTEYSALLSGGKYKVSQSRGLTVTQNENSLNLVSFENGLTNLSKQYFSPKNYAFQEGQHISKSTATKWLKRRSKSNSTGLNPVDNDKTDPDERNPIYLQQILEQDYLKKENDTYKISGMTIGLGLNDIDYYQKEQYGATFQTKISQAEREKQGKAMATKILARLRAKKGLENVKIIFALYTQAENDSLVGGTFFAQATSDSGTTLSDWKAINQENGVLPVVNEQKAVNDGDAESFSNFKSKVQSFFPNISGVTAQVHYQDKQLQGMKIKITTQFFGENEIRSFSQYVGTTATRYLPADIPIEITISSVDGMQAFLNRDQGEKSFYRHVFSSY